MKTIVEQSILKLVGGILLALMIPTLLLKAGDQHYVFLAEAFIKGKLYFAQEALQKITIEDLSYFKGNFYWPLGPFPALLLIPPILILGDAAQQSHIALILHIIGAYSLYNISRKMGINRKEDAMWITLSFLAGTPYLYAGIVSVSWYFSLIAATVALLVALYCIMNMSKNTFIAGLMLSAAIASRLPTLFSIPFFLYYIILKRKGWGKPTQQVLYFLLPIIVTLAGLGAYNYARFGNITEVGYKYQVLEGVLANTRAKQMVGVRNVPANLATLLYKGPELVFEDSTSFNLQFPYIKPHIIGMGLLFTSPFLLFLLFLKRDKISYAAIITAGLILIPHLLFFGLGYKQYGYRFSLDFLPFLYIALIRSFGSKLPLQAKLLIAYSILFNMYFIITSGPTQNFVNPWANIE